MKHRMQLHGMAHTQLEDERTSSILRAGDHMRSTCKLQTRLHSAVASGCTKQVTTKLT
jgi:hypothetical protein